MATATERSSGFSSTEHLRIVVRLAALVLWLFFCIILYQTGRFLERNPWPRFFLRGLTWIAGIEVHAEKTQTHAGAFLLANHVSWMDIPVIASATGAAFVAHDGLAANPFMRWLCAMNDTVFIARHDRGSVTGQVSQIREALRENGALAIFPEGTTGNGLELLPFKSSLLSALVPPPTGICVRPILLDYGLEASSIAWVGNEPGIDNFLRILARSEPVKVTLHFLPALTEDTLRNRKVMASHAYTAIDARLRAAQDQRVTL
ncbi:MAG TPA: lysophospholipid acyltransferase family protein [Novosphingobium sp.]